MRDVQELLERLVPFVVVPYQGWGEDKTKVISTSLEDEEVSEG